MLGRSQNLSPHIPVSEGLGRQGSWLVQTPFHRGQGQDRAASPLLSVLMLGWLWDYMAEGHWHSGGLPEVSSSG